MKSNVIKRCNTCGRFLSEDDFGWNNKQKRYRESQCKKCTKNYKYLYQSKQSKQWRIDNKEHLQKYDKQYCKNNIDKKRIYNKQYNKNNKENKKQWRIDNKKHLKQYHKQWQKDNPEKVAAINIKYRFLKEEQTPLLNENEQKRVDELYEIRNLLNHDKIDFHVDHIQPLSKGGLHHPNNLQILPDWLNHEKKNKWPLNEQEEIKYEGFRIKCD